MPAKKAAAGDDNKAGTVTCRHCRYERPAADPRCHICGYPWPWLTTAKEKTKGKRPRKT